MTDGHTRVIESTQTLELHINILKVSRHLNCSISGERIVRFLVIFNYMDMLYIISTLQNC